jgi:hypothetical protein
MHPPSKPFARPFQQIHPAIPILVILKDRLSAVATRHLECVMTLVKSIGAEGDREG